MTWYGTLDICLTIQCGSKHEEEERQSQPTSLPPDIYDPGFQVHQVMPSSHKRRSSTPAPVGGRAKAVNCGCLLGTESGILGQSCRLNRRAITIRRRSPYPLIPTIQSFSRDFSQQLNYCPPSLPVCTDMSARLPQGDELNGNRFTLHAARTMLTHWGSGCGRNIRPTLLGESFG